MSRGPKQTVDLVLNILNPDRSLDTSSHLLDVPLPLQLRDVEARIQAQGHKPATVYSVGTAKMEVKVSEGPSKYNLRQYGAKINMDQPLLHFYNQVYLEAPVPPHSVPLRTSSSSKLYSNGIAIIDGVGIGFHRTVRVPDNEIRHALPPDMGVMPLFNVSDHTENIPESMIRTGGLFLAMYQREAMWLSFFLANQSEKRAVKVHVGGINALTGLRREKRGRRQDYLAIDSTSSTQLWLDGVYTEPGVVRQFVAMPPGQGYTVESQLAGNDHIGGAQIEVYSLYSDSVTFLYRDARLNVYQTPRELGLTPGDTILLVDLSKPAYDFNKARNLAKFNEVTVPRIYMSIYKSIQITAHLLPKGKGAFGKEIQLEADPGDSIRNLEEEIVAKMVGEPKEYKFTQNNREVNVYYELEVEDWVNEAQRLCDVQGLAHGRKLVLRKHVRSYPVGDPNHERDVYAVAGSPSSVQPPLVTEPLHHYYMAARVYGKEELFNGFAVGGRISQSIRRDSLPSVAYDERNPVTLNITVINAAYFNMMTGLDPPTTPIDAATYLNKGLPWFASYEEPSSEMEDDEALERVRLAELKSVGNIFRLREQTHGGSSSSPNKGEDCEGCGYELSTIKLRPCGHRMCGNCVGRSQVICPIYACRQRIEKKKVFAAPMATRGAEEYLSAPAHTIHTTETNRDPRRDINWNREIELLAGDLRSGRIMADEEPEAAPTSSQVSSFPSFIQRSTTFLSPEANISSQSWESRIASWDRTIAYGYSTGGLSELKSYELRVAYHGVDFSPHSIL